jgi:hypothetical protein
MRFAISMIAAARNVSMKPSHITTNPTPQDEQREGWAYGDYRQQNIKIGTINKKLVVNF